MSFRTAFHAVSSQSRHSVGSVFTPLLTPKSVLSALVLSAVLAGCASDNVGHTKTTTKKTIDTPSEKTIVTETHEKDTTLTPR